MRDLFRRFGNLALPREAIIAAMVPPASFSALVLALAPPQAAPAVAPAKPKSLLVVTFDTTRRDCMGFHGNVPSVTPNLDRLAAQSCIFDDAYTVAPITLPAHASLLTGLYPASHGVHENTAHQLPKDALTLAEILKGRGYATAATVGAFVLDPMYGIDQGFDHYDSPTKRDARVGLSVAERRADEQGDLTLKEIAELSKKTPFFYWVHFFDPHFPYEAKDKLPPQPGEAATPDALSRHTYLEELHFADKHLGRLLDELESLGLMKDLVVVFAADHGESLDDTPEPSHGYFLFDATVRIPLLIRDPASKPRRVAAQASLVDVMPTVLDLLAAPERETLRFDGADLAPVVRGSADDVGERALLLETRMTWLNFGWAPFDGCVQERMKYVHSARDELFDRKADPLEKKNLFDPGEARSKALVRRVQNLLAAPAVKLGRDPLQLDEEGRQRMQKLGYVLADPAAGDGDVPWDRTQLPDSYTKTALFALMDEETVAESQGDLPRTVELLRKLSAAEPGSARFHEQLGTVLHDLGADDLDEAEQHLKEAVTIDPRRGHAYYLLALCTQGRWRRTIAELVAERRAPDSEAVRARIKVLVQKERGQAEHVVDLFRTSLKLEPHALDCLRDLAIFQHDQAVRHVRGKPPQALAEFREVIVLLDQLLELLPADEKTRPDVTQKRETVKGRIVELERSIAASGGDAAPEKGRAPDPAPSPMLVAPARAGETRVADVVSEGDVSHWVVELGGQKIGESWSSYAGLVDAKEAKGGKAHRFVGGAILSGPSAVGTIETKRTGDLLTDDLGHPLKFTLRTTVGQVVTEVAATFADGQAKVRVASGSVQSEKTIAVPPDAFLFANNFAGHVELIAALRPPKAGAPSKLQVFSPEPTVLQMVDYELRHQGEFKSQWNDEEVTGEKYRDSLGEAMKVTGDGKLIALEVPAAGIAFRRVTDPPPALEIGGVAKASSEFDVEQVVVENGAARIAGALTKKKGSSGARPAVLFVSGSGAQDRDGTSGGVDLGTHEILDRLTVRGYVVLRVDDRGAGATTGPTDDLSYDDLIGDARACVDFLMKRPDVDRKRVAVIGHSEGGETAPILAYERPLAAIVLMAAPGRSLEAVMRDQKQRALEELHLPKAAVDEELAVHAKFLELVGGDGPIDPKDVRADYAPFLAQRKWLQGHMRRDAIEQVKQVKCPVWIAQGQNDLQVSPELDAKALERALADAHHPDATLRVFPGLDHLFKRSPDEKKPALSDYLQPRPVDPEFLDALCAWLDARLKP